MKREILSAVITAIFLGYNSTAFSQDTTATMQPLKQFMTKNDLKKDLAAIEHVVVRCYAYYGVLASLLDHDNRPDRRDTVNRMLAGMDKLNEAWLGLSIQMQPKISEDVREKNFQAQSVAMAKAYVDRVNATRARTGDMFDDEVIKSDGAVCLEIINSL